MAIGWRAEGNTGLSGVVDSSNNIVNTDNKDDSLFSVLGSESWRLTPSSDVNAA